MDTFVAGVAWGDSIGSEESGLPDIWCDMISDIKVGYKHPRKASDKGSRPSDGKEDLLRPNKPLFGEVLEYSR